MTRSNKLTAREDYKWPSLNSTDSIRTEFSLGTRVDPLVLHQVPSEFFIDIA
jgi:hypothetical protein